MAVALHAVAGGLKDGKVKNAAGQEFDIYAISEISSEPQQDEIEVKGDDELKAIFISNKREELSITMNGISFDMLQAITGNNVESSATGVKIPLGTDSEMNPPEVEVSAYSNAVDENNNNVTFRKIWHKVTIKDITLSQAGESEMSVEMTGIAYPTATDIEGDALGSKRIATIEIYQAA